MDNRFFERSILNSPYSYPLRHWELDDQGQPTQQIIEKRLKRVLLGWIVNAITISSMMWTTNYTNIGVDRSCNSL